MEGDIVFRILTGITYPLVYRHDRSLYNVHPQLDPIQLMRNTFLAAFAGYWVGKVYKGRQNLFSLAFPIPLFAKYFYDQWTQSRTTKRYQEFHIQSSPVRSQTRKEGNFERQNDNKSKEKTHRIVRNMPHLQNKIYNAQDFVSQLQKEYYQ